MMAYYVLYFLFEILNADRTLIVTYPNKLQLFAEEYVPSLKDKRNIPFISYNSTISFQTLNISVTSPISSLIYTHLSSISLIGCGIIQFSSVNSLIQCKSGTITFFRLHFLPKISENTVFVSTYSFSAGDLPTVVFSESRFSSHSSLSNTLCTFSSHLHVSSCIFQNCTHKKLLDESHSYSTTLTTSSFIHCDDVFTGFFLPPQHNTQSFVTTNCSFCYCQRASHKLIFYSDASISQPIHITPQNCTFSDTTFDTFQTVELSNSCGGALCLQGQPQLSLSVTRCQFSNCVANKAGGAIMCDGAAAVLIRFSTFLDCNALEGAGGACVLLFIDSPTEDSITSVTSNNFTLCTSTGNGGALFIDLPEFNEPNNTVLFSCCFLQCYCPSASRGGALYFGPANGCVIARNCRFQFCGCKQKTTASASSANAYPPKLSGGGGAVCLSISRLLTNISEPLLQYCTFGSNSAPSGNDVYICLLAEFSRSADKFPTNEILLACTSSSKVPHVFLSPTRNVINLQEAFDLETISLTDHWHAIVLINLLYIISIIAILPFLCLLSTIIYPRVCGRFDTNRRNHRTFCCCSSESEQPQIQQDAMEELDDTHVTSTSSSGNSENPSLFNPA